MTSTVSLDKRHRVGTPAKRCLLLLFMGAMLLMYFAPAASWSDELKARGLEERMVLLSQRRGGRAQLAPILFHTLERYLEMPGEAGDKLDKAFASRFNSHPDLIPTLQLLLTRYRQAPRATLEIAMDPALLSTPARTPMDLAKMRAAVLPFRSSVFLGTSESQPEYPTHAPSSGSNKPGVLSLPTGPAINRSLLDASVKKAAEMLVKLPPRIDRITSLQPVSVNRGVGAEGFFYRDDQVRFDGYDNRKVTTIGVLPLSDRQLILFDVPGWAGPGKHTIQVVRFDEKGKVIARSNKVELEVGDAKFVREAKGIFPASPCAGVTACIEGRFMASDLVYIDSTPQETKPGVSWDPSPNEWITKLSFRIVEDLKPGRHLIWAGSKDGREITNKLSFELLPKERYTNASVRFTRLHCEDETNPEEWGNDEVFVVFYVETDDVVYSKVTRVYGDMYDGMSKMLDTEDGKVFGPGGSPARVENRLRIWSAAYEDDGSDVEQARRLAIVSELAAESLLEATGESEWVDVAQVAGSLLDEVISLFGGTDYLGEDTWAWTQPDLLKLVDSGSRYCDATYRYEDGKDGKYTLDCTLTVEEIKPKE